jgi:hypothetical protein
MNAGETNAHISAVDAWHGSGAEIVEVVVIVVILAFIGAIAVHLFNENN